MDKLAKKFGYLVIVVMLFYAITGARVNQGTSEGLNASNFLFVIPAFLGRLTGNIGAALESVGVFGDSFEEGTPSATELLCNPPTGSFDLNCDGLVDEKDIEAANGL